MQLWVLRHLRSKVDEVHVVAHAHDHTSGKTVIILSCCCTGQAGTCSTHHASSGADFDYYGRDDDDDDDNDFHDNDGNKDAHTDEGRFISGGIFVTCCETFGDRWTY